MNVQGSITGIKYQIFLTSELESIDINEFDINQAPSSCIIKNGNNTFAISKWISPKRTRSYPFERVFNTLNFSKRVTVIPIVKDEGIEGDRDFIQWDTISLMSLLDVYVIFAYYKSALLNPKKKNKITKQNFDNNYILKKIKEIEQYHSSALHWNLNEINSNLFSIMEIVKKSYLEIENKTKIKLHGIEGLDNFINKLSEDVSIFMNFSREKAEKAQNREFKTLQPKESLASLNKAKITIKNYLGGKYFLTVDEIIIRRNQIQLIESKHSRSALLPNKSDIKDGLLKMILYSNLSNVSVENVRMKSECVLNLTSSKLIGQINTKSSTKEISDFMIANRFSKKNKELIEILFRESNANNFIINIQHSK